jgi:hypothetical protein
MPGSILLAVLLCAELLSHEKRGTAADQRNGRGPVMQAQHHTSDHRGNTGDLSNLSDEIQFGVCHFLSSVARARHTLSVSIRLWHIDDDPPRLVGQRGSALVTHFGQLLDGALPDFLVLGVEQPLPSDEQIAVAVNLFDEFARI